MRHALIGVMTTNRYRVVIALDLTEYSPIVLQHAVELARCHGASELHAVTVVSDRRESERAQRELALLVLPALEELGDTDWTARMHIREGKAPREIADLAGETRAHVLVLGRFGTHRPHRHIGKTASDMIDLAPCPTLVVGLTDQTDSAVPQCPDCVAARADLDGRRWFCTTHASPERLQLSARVESGASLTGGGLLW
ncbi:hypothetical protein BH11MYX3_BH11MYX3_12090 [soil metagenome]